MQLGHRIGSQPCCLRRRVAPPVVAPVRVLAPPNIVAPHQRRSVLIFAKRSSKRGGKKPDDDVGSDENAAAASGWDAALSNIPTEDEAAESATPESPESPESPEASSSVYVEPESASSQPSSTSSGPGSEPEQKKRSTVITLAEYRMLVEAAEAKQREEDERREREAREAAGTSLTVPESADLDATRQGFQAFALNGGSLELLVAETLDGRLALADSYVGAVGAGPAGGTRYTRPELEGDVPAEPLVFQYIPWVERCPADLFGRKEAVSNIKKLYFINMLPTEDGQDIMHDLDNVFVFDADKQLMSRSEVTRVGSAPLLEPVLRIRPSGLTLEESILLPEPAEVSEAALVGEAADEVDPDEFAARMEELEKAAEQLDELDEAPDVPGVDMM